MADDKLTDYSIAKALQDQSLVSNTAIQEYQEDYRVSEKERLQSSQKRSQLIESLRKSMKQASLSTRARDGIQQEFERVIQEGSPQEIERTIIHYQKQLTVLQSKALVSNQTNEFIHNVFNRVNVFLEKKKLLEKIEYTTESIFVSGQGDKTSATVSKLTTVSTAIRTDLFSLVESILSQIVIMEECIQKDVSSESKLRDLFYACLSSVDEQKKSKLILLCQKKIPGSAYRNRLHFYQSIVGELAKTDTRVARKVHSHIRKEARSLLKEGDTKKAIAELCYALHLWKDDVYTYRLLANLFFSLNNEKNAFIALGEALRLCPEDDRLRKRVAEYYARRKFLPKAIHEYEIILDHSPENLDIRLELGRLLYENKSFDRVPNVLLDYYQALPDDVTSMNYIGNSYLYLNRWKEVIYFLSQSIRKNPAQPEIYHALSFAYRKLELLEQAIQSLKQGIRNNPESLSLKIQLGTVYTECEMWEQVLDCLLPALKTHPDSSSLLTSIGQAYYYIGNLEEALSLLNKAYELKSDDPITLTMLARTYKKKREL